MTGLFKAFDASVPPRTAPAGCAAVNGYLGGLTPHVWSIDEWNRFADLRKFGYWLPDPSNFTDGTSQGHAAAAQARRLGWKPFARDRRIIGNDMETWVSASLKVPLTEAGGWSAPQIRGYCNDFANAVWQDGFIAVTYGSLSTVFGNPDTGLGYVVAAWDDVPIVESIPHVVGHQYEADIPFEGTHIDFTVYDSTVYNNFGFGPRVLVSA